MENSRQILNAIIIAKLSFIGYHLGETKIDADIRTRRNYPGCDFAFEKIDLTQCIWNILYTLHTDPAVYVPELVGAINTCGFYSNAGAK